MGDRAGTEVGCGDGSVYFTAVGGGQLYLCQNPTEPQSAMEGEVCLEEDKACTIHVSVSHRTKTDPAGEQPAAFQAASPDGKEGYFTSPEMLTNDAYTGKEQPEVSIARDSLPPEAANLEPGFIKKKAIGMAIFGSTSIGRIPQTARSNAPTRKAKT